MHVSPDEDDARAWAGRAPDVTACWFVRQSGLHGVRHTQRVHIHAQRLVRELRWPAADADLVLTAALWHDIGRVDDGWDERHGALSVARIADCHLDASLAEPDARIVRFAIHHHCLDDDYGRLRATDEDDPERSLEVLRLLKDADALDRVRLVDATYGVDPKMLRHPCAPSMIDFALELFRASS
jgi:HD superfamily phosphodiesterase